MIRKLAIVGAAFWLLAVVVGFLWSDRESRANRPSPQMLELRSLQDLYGAGLYDEVVKECDRAETDPRCVDIGPQILYSRWMAQRRLGNAEQVRETENLFLQRFPDHPLAADLHFSRATTRLAHDDYAGADSELAIIETHFPTTAIAPDVRKLRGRLPLSATRPS